MDIASLLGLLAKVVIIIPLDYAMDTLSSTVDLEPTIWSVCLPNFYLILGQSAHFCWSSLLWAHVVFFTQTWSPTNTTIVWANRNLRPRVLGISSSRLAHWVQILVQMWMEIRIISYR